MSDSQYTKQLNKLKKQFEEFNQKNTPVHDANSLKTDDPDVDSIIRAFSYLTARLVEHVETKHNDFYQLISQQLLGNLILSKPSVSLAKLANDQLDTPLYLLEKDKEFNPQKQTSIGDAILYSVATDTPISTISITSVTEETVTDGSNIVINISNNGPQDHKVSDFTFYILGEYISSVNLFSLLNMNLERIIIRGLNSSKTYDLPKENLTPYGYEVNQALFTDNNFDLDELGLLLDFAIMPSKLLAYKLDFFPISDELFSENSQVSIKFSCRLRENIPYPSFNKEVLNNVHANIVPIKNVFKAISIPTKIDHKDHIVPVDIAKSNGQQFVYSIDNVTGIISEKGKGDVRRVYTNFNDYVYVIDETDRQLVYQLRIGQENAGDPSFSLQLAYGKNEDITLSETIVCNIKVTNGKNASIPIGTDFTSLEGYTLSTVTESSEYVPALRAEDQEIAFMYDIAISKQMLKTKSDLQGILSYILFLSGQRENQRFRSAIESIVDIQYTEGTKMKGVNVVYGQIINIQFDTEKLSCIGEIYLFGLILNKLFASFAPINYFSQILVYDKNILSMPLFVLPTILGDKHLVSGRLV